MRQVVFSASVGAAVANLFPDCIEQDTVLRGFMEHNLFTDVSPFGLSGCFLENCQDSDKWITPSEGACAEACDRIEGCQHWSYGKEDGHNKCWLRQSDGGREAADRFLSGSKECRPVMYPACAEHDVMFAAPPGQELEIDLSRQGKTMGCLNDKCESTDRFMAGSLDECAEACVQAKICRKWSWGDVAGVPTCFLLPEEVERHEEPTFISSSIHCAPITAWEEPLPIFPPTKLPIHPGNEQCWSGGYDFNFCCGDHLGVGGNPHCWDSEMFNFQNCCYPPGEAEL